MPNERKIKAKIVELGLSISLIANEMGISAYTLGRKISGKTPMSIKEARALQNRLSIPDEDIVSYFFDNRVAQNAT